MQGSLDDPPIVIYVSRWKLASWFVGGVAAVIFGFWLNMHFPSRPLLETVFVHDAFVGGGCVLLLTAFCYVLWPPRLEISPGGVLWRSVRRTRTFAWKEFAGFVAYWPTSKNTFSYNKYTGFNYMPDDARRGRPVRMRRWWYGADASFGCMWELSADKLVSLLKQAKKKWG